jgi:amidophosphoribosyltransferase
MSDKPHDYCGIFGIYDHADAALNTYYGLHALQHRGQESAGIVTSYFDSEKGQMRMPVHKDFGLVLKVFEDAALFRNTLRGNAAIGHNRYSTAGSSNNPANIQPFRVQYKNGNLAIGHNGNLSNARQLRDRFRKEGVLFQSTSDTELILHLIARSQKNNQIDQILDALSHVEGAYCLVILTDDKLIAVRDPNGFRPLALGKLNGAFVVASETCAFDMIGATYERDIQPGEVVIIDAEASKRGEVKSVYMPPKSGTATSQCIFEYVYFSRPDSRIFGESVDKVRRKIGKFLAREHPLGKIIRNKDGKKPVVISVPDSSNTAAIGYASESKKLGFDCKFDIGLIRNHYVGRTFISPGQGSRELKVRTKFNIVRGVLEGRPVVLVDDSIVRGTTSRHLVNMIRSANPSEVHFMVSSPPIIEPCHYGMDFPSPNELMANVYNRDIKAMAEALGVDTLNYLSPMGLVNAVKEANASPHGYCTACFTGEYPVPVNLNVDKEENEVV